MKHYKHLFCIALCLCATLFLSACSVKQVEYKEVDLSANVEDLTEAMGEKPNKETKEDDGSTTYTYKKSKFLDYVGTMDYREYDGTMVYSRWSYSAKEDADAKEVYNAICEKMTEDYGKGSASDADQSTTFESEDKSVVVAYATEDDNKIVCITTMMK